VWLQRPDGEGGWENVPTGLDPPVSQPDVNPLTTGEDGQYQWDVLAGSYRVRVEAPGYYATDSPMVSIPPPVTDLHVGLVPIGVPNLPPMAEAGGPYVAEEGSPVTLDASGSSDPDGEIVLYEWDLDNDGDFDEATGEMINFTFFENGVLVIGLRVTDDLGKSFVDAAEVTVHNVAPQVNAGDDRTAEIGESVHLAPVTFSDGNMRDKFSATIDWGDGFVESGQISVEDGVGSVVGSHAYTESGDFAVEICVGDGDGGVGCGTFIVTVTGTPACTDLSLVKPRFRRDNFKINLHNNSSTDSYTLSHILFYWPADAEELDWMELGDHRIWNGRDREPPTDTLVEPGWRSGAEKTIGPDEMLKFNVDFDHPPDLETFASFGDFAGTTFYFEEGCSLTFEPDEPPPDDELEEPPEFLTCPAGYELVGNFDGFLRRDKEPRSKDHSFSLVAGGAIWITGFVKEGHPERGCPGHPTCDQNQDHEDVELWLDGALVGVYEDADHGPEENAWYPFGALEIYNPQGEHELTYAHTLHGDGPQSVDYRFTTCVLPAEPPPEDVCESLSLQEARFDDDNFLIDLRNNSSDMTYTLERVVLYWPEGAEKVDWMKLDGERIWDGSHRHSPTDTSAEPGWRGGSNTEIGPGQSRTFDVDFDDPDDLEDFAKLSDFFGSTFYFAGGCTLTFDSGP
jgi:hypothetical protein